MLGDELSFLSTMPPQSPQLGSLAIQAPSQAARTVHVSASTCHDVSAFKGASYQRRSRESSQGPERRLLTDTRGGDLAMARCCVLALQNS